MQIHGSPNATRIIAKNKLREGSRISKTIIYISRAIRVREKCTVHDYEACPETDIIKKKQFRKNTALGLKRNNGK